MKYAKLIFLPLLMLALSCDKLENLDPALAEPNLDEMVTALKEALETGTGRAVEGLNEKDGYFGDELVKILFPPEATKVANTLRDMGAGALVDDFVLSMNRAAEDAVSEAAPIFVGAITDMTFDDAKGILLGPDDAATEYFKGKTNQQLYDLFKPKIQNALDRASATKHWNDITSTYNSIPLVTPVNTDLPDYATTEALEGLFLKLEGEEAEIRQDPAARTTDAMKKVFEWAESQ
ncbi:MAG: DUF4197 domain-containing protein [Bacteroidia bacterium]